MTLSLLGLGSNIGDREAALMSALERLSRHDAIRVVARSAWRETPAIGGPPGQTAFLNGAALVDTSLPPEALLDVLLGVERELGRRRTVRWAARTLDLDLLLYGELVLITPSLELPHPRMALRRFVLEPAVEIAPNMLHPTTGWTLTRLLSHLNTARPYVAIAGPIGSGKTQLAGGLAATGVRLVSESVDDGRLASFYADPTSHAWQTELEFLKERARLLGTDSPLWADRSTWVASDFWFDQSPAFARAWLPPERASDFFRAWEAARREVARPKFVVLLDTLGEELLARVRRRGRPYEQRLSLEQLERIREEICLQTTAADTGPVLRLENASRDDALAETLAAMHATQ